MHERPLKLLIVEDEANVRSLIRLLPDWASLGVTVAGEASTGAEALDMMAEQLPDIVLTDIEMPYMDGLTLSRRILDRYSDVSVVILTAHDHFPYVQQALQAGVSNYLLKPLDKAALERALRDTAEQIRSRRLLLSRMETSYKYVQNHRQFFRDRLLGELTHKGLSEGLEDILEMVGVRFRPGGRYTLALMNIANSGVVSFAAQKYFMLNNCRTYIEGNYAAGGRLHLFADGLDNLALLSADDEADLSDICRQVTEAIGDSLQCRLYCGVSDPGHGAADLPLAYAQARDALRLALVSGEDIVLGHAEGDCPVLDRRALEERIPDLLLFVKSGLGDKAAPLASALLQQAGALGDGDLNAAKIFAIGFLARATDTLADQGIPWLTLVRRVTPCYPQILEHASFPAVAALFSEQIASLCALAESFQRQKSGETVSRILRDLEEGYGDANLSLAALARKYALNSSYLSRAFKAHTGKSFTEYLIEMRIQKACDLLEQGDCKAYQLAQLVGVPDPNYFAKCFKKVTGASFQAYKAELGRR